MPHVPVLPRGTLDPLLARVLVLEAGEQRVALVTLDLGRPFGAASLESLRAAAKRNRAGYSNLLVVASHTHAGPLVKDEYPGEGTWEAATLEKIGTAIEDAQRSSQAVRVVQVMESPPSATTGAR